MIALARASSSGCRSQAEVRPTMISGFHPNMRVHAGVDAEPCPRAIGDPKNIAADLPDPVAFPCTLFDTHLKRIIQGPQLFLDPLGVGDIVKDAAEAEAGHLGVAEIFAAASQPSHLAVVGPDDAELRLDRGSFGGGARTGR